MPGTSGPKRSEDSEGPSFSGKLFTSIVALLSSVIEGGHIKTELTLTSPAPGMFRVGDNFRRWKFQVKETFRRLRACFTTDLNRLEVCRQFHGRIQHPGEKLAAFIREPRRLCAEGFTDDTPEVREQRIHQQALEGTGDPSTCRAFLTANPTSIPEALDRAGTIEQVNGVFERDQQVPRQVLPQHDSGVWLIAANGTDIRSVGWLNVPVTLGEKVREHLMLVVDNLPWDAILGSDFLITQQDTNVATTFPLPTLHRIVRLIRLDGLAHRATAEWQQADGLAVDVPRWTSEPDHLTDASTSQTLDWAICEAAGGTNLCGLHTRLGALVLYIEGVLKVHSVILHQLKTGPHQATFHSGEESLSRDCASPLPAHSNRVSSAESSLTTTCPTHRDKSHRSRKKNKTSIIVLAADPSVATKCQNSPYSLGSSAPKQKEAVLPKGSPPISASEHDRKYSCLLDRKSENDLEKRSKMKRLTKSDELEPCDLQRPNVDSILSAVTNTDAESESIASSGQDVTPLGDRERVPSQRSAKKFKANKPEEFGEESCTGEPRPNHDRSSKLKRSHKDAPAEKAGNRIKTKSDVDVASNLVSNPTKHVHSEAMPVVSTPVEPYLPVDSNSPDYPPSSPSPPVRRRRSKSLAPVSTMKGSNVKNELSANGATVKTKKPLARHSQFGPDLDDTTYHPKRVRAINSKVSHSESDSDRSSSPPSYRPSVPPTTDEKKSNRRSLRSVSVGRSLSVCNGHASQGRHENDSSHNSTNDSIGYSPTKQISVDGITSKAKSNHLDPIPVYRVSRIPSSPPPSSQPTQSLSPGNHGAFKTSIGSHSGDSKVASSCHPTASSSGRSVVETVPSFYTRWKNDSSAQPTNVASYGSLKRPPTTRR
ncbi:hypothetical protein EG68_05551 [Paragonimus skrjabini miyazakii]|uniref:Uncharacterized protein n=1 Tax=Paragonimus skrjabini miyazakii TaxID=59628 RepID=A0A8S9Y999_9TREM|nr:hypothetical protein EG68_05551 [Paragonimus skrjabini miyazakii]